MDDTPTTETPGSSTFNKAFEDALDSSPSTDTPTPSSTLPSIPIVPEPGPSDLPLLLEEPKDEPSVAPEVEETAPLDAILNANQAEMNLDPGNEFEDILGYNGRDCSVEMNDLKLAWDELRRKPMYEITLDITPQIEPTKSKKVEAAARRENLARAPIRKWRDRKGDQVAFGKLVDYRNGEVFIRDPDGNEHEISWYELSNEDLCFVTAWWELPSELNPHSGTYQVRDWTRISFTWTASALCHKPLYFEEVQLERYGHSAGPVKQAALSGVHFFGNIFFLPYHIGLNPPNECQYALGYYRPGSCAPWLLPATPLSARGARMQLGALVAGLALLP